MCGICGGVDLSGGAGLDPRALEAMSATLVHRGPDSAGLVELGPAGLAMRRLAIIDVQGGLQPLANEDATIHLICNGEIYNHRELRKDVEARGHCLRTGSDSEPLLHAYEEWGVDFLERVNGMFALALWDAARQRLLLARDRTGIKPLYYAQHGSLLLFASEPKAILAYPGFPRGIDLVALDRYLAHEYVPTPASIFQGIRKLRPGHRLTLDLADPTPRETPYHRIDLTPDPALARSSEDDLARELWRRLREAVGMELMSDVPLGVFLSGGIDSSAVAAAMSEINPGSVHSFSIGFEDPSFDESAYARRAAHALGTRHHERILDPRMVWELVPKVMEFLDEPLADPSIIPTHLLSRFARETVTVALGGDGGDELFAGYPTLQAHRLAGLYRRLPAWVRRGLIEPVVNRLPVSHNNMSLDFRAKRFVKAAREPVERRHHLWLGAFPHEERQRLLAPDIARAVAAEPPFAALEEHLASCRSYDDLSRILYLDMKMYMEGDILVKVDRASMGCSLEVRVPLLNQVLLDFALRLPIDLKLRGFTRKYLLKKALRGKLPDDIIDRPKRGFGFPVARWLRAELKPLLLDLLSEGRLRRQGLFRPEYVGQLVREHLELRRDNRKALWTLLVFQLWHDRRFG